MNESGLIVDTDGELTTIYTNSRDPQKEVWYILITPDLGLQCVTGRDLDNHAWADAFPHRFTKKEECEQWIEKLTKCVEKGSRLIL